MPYDTESQDDHSPRSLETLLIPPAKPLNITLSKVSKRSWLETRYGRLCIAVGLLCFTLLATSYLVIALRDRPYVQPLGLPWIEDFADNSKLLISSKPMSRFRDNLRPAPYTKFITAWPSSGWTNDVIAAANLIYMGILTGRTPVIPPFTPSHVGSINDVGPIAFRDIFDIPRLANQLGIHIVEWDELKHPAVAAVTNMNVGSEVEQLGCWSPWMLNKADGERPRDSAVPRWYNLDISYTPVPPSFTLSHGHQKDQYYTSLWSLVSLAFPKTRDWAWETQKSRTLPATTGPKEALKPDDQMLCFDLLYYIGLANEEEWFADYAPYWKTVGTHMYWAPKLIGLAEEYLRRHFNVTEAEPIPNFISVHIRRADFAGWCPSNMNKEACFAPMSAYARRVKDIRDALRARPGGSDVHHVLVTSDERDPEWWAEVAELGPEWGWVDHGVEQTVQKYGKWYPVVLDAVFQSMGIGFVGTDHSTMSLLAQKRVEDWNQGLGAEVRWGTPGADDH